MARISQHISKRGQAMSQLGQRTGKVGEIIDDIGSALAAAVTQPCRDEAEFGTALGRYHARSAERLAAKRVPNRGGKERSRHPPLGRGAPPADQGRGKISDDVIAKYDAAHNESA